MVSGLFFIIAPFFFLYPLFRWGTSGILIFIGALIVGGFILLRVFVIYSFNVFVITDERIIDIDQRGFFDRTVSETTYDKIQDVSFRIKGIAQTLFKYGHVVIQTAGTQANIELHGVKEPERVQQTIIQIQREAVKNSGISVQDIAAALEQTQRRSNANRTGDDHDT
ncbi:MAG: PH domain-containing protein [Patescibacteria group bacterium]